jgi:hypothetical protein
MMYTKPQLSGYPAIAVIQSGGSSKNGMTLEGNPNFHTIPAYEADE